MKRAVEQSEMYCTAVCKCKFAYTPGTWLTYLTSVLKQSVADDHARCHLLCYATDWRPSASHMALYTILENRLEV